MREKLLWISVCIAVFYVQGKEQCLRAHFALIGGMYKFLAFRFLSIAMNG
jgi:hypothetical protein